MRYIYSFIFLYTLSFSVFHSIPRSTVPSSSVLARRRALYAFHHGILSLGKLVAFRSPPPLSFNNQRHPHSQKYHDYRTLFIPHPRQKANAGDDWPGGGVEGGAANVHTWAAETPERRVEELGDGQRLVVFSSKGAVRKQWRASGPGGLACLNMVIQRPLCPSRLPSLS